MIKKIFYCALSMVSVTVIISSCTNNINEDRFILTESKLNTLNLLDPLSEKLLHANFPEYKVQSFTYEQDGPTVRAFKIFGVNEDESITFKMGFEDSTHIDRVLVFARKGIDEYGLRIGDKFTDILDKRKNIEWMTDFDQTTYVYGNGSKIAYVIFGDFNIEDFPDPELIKFEKEDLINWKIERIEWISTLN